MNRFRIRSVGPTGDENHLIERLRAASQPLRSPRDLDPLLDQIGEARFVLLGEASHGTSEYYTWRTELSKRLITEKGFSFIAVEGDWPDCYRVNRFVKGLTGSSHSAEEVLHTFDRWPTWMWANREVVELTQWLRQHNDNFTNSDQKVGFFGLDVYSLWDSLQAVTDFLKRIDPATVEAAYDAFQCFEPFGEDVHKYARATKFVASSCEDEVISLLAQLLANAPQYEEQGREAFFNAEQNAIVARNAEHYYRTMIQGGAASWNIRDEHMVLTLERLMQHHGPGAKAIVWEHNTHVGDARATDMARAGMINVGQLVRERHGDLGVYVVGFGCHRGHVIAADAWDARMERLVVPPAAPGSYEDLLHRASDQDKLLLLDALADDEAFLTARGHRAIGVVYHPEYERPGNYVPTVLPYRYDAFLFIDQTEAVSPLHMPVRQDLEAPETFPTGV